MKIRAMRTAAALLLVAAAAAAAGDWVIFKGQVDGPAAKSGMDLATFKLKNYGGLLWSEGYYHHLNFPSGEMVTVNIGVNKSEVNLAVVYAKPGMEPYRDFVIVDADEARWDASGFGLTVGKTRVKLDGDKYTMDIELPKTTMHIVLDALAPSVSYGDGTVRYPDGDSFMYYSLPIPWARATVSGKLGGKDLNITGFGNMNHDAGVMFPTNLPANWQVFWFFGEDHALLLTDYISREKFGGVPIQRLVFARPGGNIFTSTSFTLTWDDWQDAVGIKFKFPRKFHLSAEAGSAKLTCETTQKQVLLLEDLFSNLPDFLAVMAKKVTKNGWTTDAWAEYTITYSEGGQTKEYKGVGITRYMDLEEE